MAKKSAITKKNIKTQRKKASLHCSFSLSWPCLSEEKSLRVLELLSKLVDIQANLINSTLVDSQAEILVQTSKTRYPLVIGLKEVTKAVERGLADFVVVTNLREINFLTHHLLSLCVNNQVPVGSVEQLSSRIAPLLNIKSAICLAAVKNSNCDGDGAVNEIKACLELITFPWLQASDISAKTLSKDIFQPTQICVNKSA